MTAIVGAKETARVRGGVAKTNLNMGGTRNLMRGGQRSWKVTRKGAGRRVS